MENVLSIYKYENYEVIKIYAILVNRKNCVLLFILRIIEVYSSSKCYQNPINQVVFNGPRIERLF